MDRRQNTLGRSAVVKGSSEVESALDQGLEEIPKVLVRSEGLETH